MSSINSTDNTGAPAHHGQILNGDGTWKWHAVIDGDDILVRGVLATFFGGDHDPMDDGRTASGLMTKGHPDLLGCALPMALRGRRVRSTAGSPMPQVPWATEVRVWAQATGRVIVVPVIDLGPSKWTGHALDLTIAAFRALGLSLEAGVASVDYRVLNGAVLAGLKGDHHVVVDTSARTE